MSLFLATLGTEVDSFVTDESLANCVVESKSLLASLKNLHGKLMEDDCSDELINNKCGELERKVDSWNARILKSEKKYNSRINKFGKVINNDDTVDLDQTYLYPLRMDETNDVNLTKAIILHLFRIGQIDVINDLISQQNLSVNRTYIDNFIKLNQILDEINHNSNLGPAIEWAAENSDNLRDLDSNLEFNLHKLQFILLYNDKTQYNNGGSAIDHSYVAFSYAKANLAKFGGRHLDVISKLITSIAFSGELPELNPYRDLVSLSSVHELSFRNIATQFSQNYCQLLGLSNDSTIFQTLLSGHLTLSNFNKFSKISSKLNLQSSNLGFKEIELPFETNLPNNLQFHSIFICPVSKEQTTETNPSMSLPCNHILSKESVMKLSRNGGGGASFKCPYCPTTCLVSQTKECYFIDL